MNASEYLSSPKERGRKLDGSLVSVPLLQNSAKMENVGGALDDGSNSMLVGIYDMNHFLRSLHVLTELCQWNHNRSVFVSLFEGNFVVVLLEALKSLSAECKNT